MEGIIINKLNMYKFLFAIFILVISSVYASASPCDCIDRGLKSSQKEILKHEIEKQLKRTVYHVLQSFIYGEWSIIYVEPSESDEVFLFYAHNPLTSNYVAMWSGAAMHNEEKAIMYWVLENVPGIPEKLAACFAWHVTKERDM
jgi:hypothetical protein